MNPKGYVPALTLDSGETLTENICVLQYIADRNPAAKLAPAYGTMERYRLIEWLAFISSEVHKNFSPLFRADAAEETRQFALGNITKRLDYLQQSPRRPRLPHRRAVHDRRLLPRGGAQLERPREARSGQMARA